MAKRAKLRKNPVQSRSRQTVDAIIEAGARILADDGYRHMTTNRVAEVAGVSIGSLYQYFSGKDAVLGAILNRHQARIRDAIGAHFDAAHDLSRYAGTRRLIEAVVHSHAIEPRLHARLELLRQDGALPSDLGADPFSYVSGKLQEALEKDFSDTIRDPHRSARLLVTAVHAMIQAHERGDIPCTQETLIDDISDLVFGYVKGDRHAAER